MVGYLGMVIRSVEGDRGDFIMFHHLAKLIEPTAILCALVGVWFGVC